jgi:hypothetical protein
MRAELIIAVIFTFVGLSFIPPIMGNPASYMQLTDNVVIDVQSPQDGATYNVQTMPLYFTVQTNNNGQLPTCYFLNNQSPIDVPVWVTSKEIMTGLYGYGDGSVNHTFTYPRYTALGNTVLKNLPNGKYNLTVERYHSDISNPQRINSTSVSFTIDTTKSQSTPVFSPPPAPYPKLTLISPDNGSNVAPFTGADYKTGGTLGYYETIVKFGSNVLPSWVGYSIDGGTNTTVPIYDTAKVKLPLGSHIFTLYGNDTLGNWATPQTVYPSVITFKDWIESGQQKSPTVSPTSTATANVTSYVDPPAPIDLITVMFFSVIAGVVVLFLILAIRHQKNR